MAVLETRTRGEVPAVVERRSGTAGPDSRSGRERPSRMSCPAACALLSAGLAIHNWWMDGATSSKQEKGEAEPTRPGRVVRWVAWLRRTLAFGADGLSTGGRRSSDRRSVPPSISGYAAPRQREPLRVLCVFAVFLGRWVAFVSSCLRVCDVLCVSLCVSVPLWFMGLFGEAVTILSPYRVGGSG